MEGRHLQNQAKIKQPPLREEKIETQRGKSLAEVSFKPILSSIKSSHFSWYWAVFQSEEMWAEAMSSYQQQ